MKCRAEAGESGIVTRVRMKTSKFEYVCGWETGKDSLIYIECKDCGLIFKKSDQFTRPSRHRPMSCPNCDNIIRQIKQEEILKAKELAKKKAIAEKEARTQHAKLIKIKTKTCKSCNSLFETTKSNKVYCSDKCAKSAIYRMKDAYRYDFPLSEVYSKSSGKCSICGGLCDWNDYKVVNGVIIYGNNYPSRDHIIPKSKGGLNTWSNIALAHRLCNSQKGAKLDAV